jgi:transcriptional regulator with XRE-family HTH domain
MAGIGARLREIRQQMRLSLREVEERSHLVAQERGDLSFQVSASWLDRLERSEHELTVNKLLALAEIYNTPIDQLLRTLYPETEKQNPEQPSSPSNRPSSDETKLLPTEARPSGTPYRRAVIGKDATLDPMIPAGCTVQIDTRKREISPKQDWAYSLQRPIYFLKTKDGFFCGWCELDENSQWLTLIPHPLSSSPTRRWIFGIEVENLGRVVAVVIRLGDRV